MALHRNSSEPCERPVAVASPLHSPCGVREVNEGKSIVRNLGSRDGTIFTICCDRVPDSRLKVASEKFSIIKMADDKTGLISVGLLWSVACSVSLLLKRF